MMFDDDDKFKKQIMAIIRGFFDVISDTVMRDDELIFYCLAHLDGILEDNRSRIKYFIALMT